jgi:hypothetical protein
VRKQERAKDERKVPLRDARVPADVAELVCCKVINLASVSTFAKRQADCATLFVDGVEQTAPGLFVLKSPFRESFIASLFAYINPNSGFSAAETIAYALPRHAEWVLKVSKIDRIRQRFAAEVAKPLEPVALRGSLEWWQGFIAEDGTFTLESEGPGSPGILVYQEIKGEHTSLALEIRGSSVERNDSSFRKTLLNSALRELLLAMKLVQRRRGRPHQAQKAESIAYSRDHQRLTKPRIAGLFCSCGQQRHTRACYDRLDALADNFYAVQRSRFKELIISQHRKNL